MNTVAIPEAPVTSGKVVRQCVEAGWELWYVARRDRLPGSWELRWRGKQVRVHWDAIAKIQRNLKWWRENIEDSEEAGGHWCYRLRKSGTQMGLL